MYLFIMVFLYKYMHYLVLLMIAFLRKVGIFGIDIIELNYVHNYLVVGNLPMDLSIWLKHLYTRL